MEDQPKMDDQDNKTARLAQQVRQAVQDVTARRVERYAVPGVFRVFRDASDEVVVESFQ